MEISNTNTNQSYWNNTLQKELLEAAESVTKVSSEPIDSRITQCATVLKKLGQGIQQIKAELALIEPLAENNWEESLYLNPEERSCFSQSTAENLVNDIRWDTTSITDKIDTYSQTSWENIRMRFQYLKDTFSDDQLNVKWARTTIQTMIDSHRMRVTHLNEQNTALEQQVKKIKELELQLKIASPPVPATQGSSPPKESPQTSKRKYVVLAAFMLVGAMLAYAYYLHASKAQEAFILRKSIARH